MKQKHIIIISIILTVIVTYLLTMIAYHSYFEDKIWSRWMDGDMARWNPSTPEEGYYRIIIQQYNYENKTFVEISDAKELMLWESKPILYMKGERFSLLQCWNCR